MKRFLKTICCGVLCFFFAVPAIHGQEKETKKVSFRDSIDHQFDLSDWIINKRGFVPVATIITEPSLGGFGAALAPVFIEQNKPKFLNGKVYPQPPNVTTAFGGWTLNDTWAVGAARVGMIPKWGIKYAVAGGYANVNMDYYFNLEQLGKEVDFGFNIKTIPVMLSVSKQLKNPRFTVGFKYMFMHNDIQVNDNNGNEAWRQTLDDKISDYLSGNVGKLGLQASYDSRDNTFTPDKGLKINLTADWSNPVVGSDYKYGQFEGAAYYYFPLLHNLITGTRFDMQQAVGDIPFYIKPFVDMRGVPTARYSGKTTILAEVEERWDFTKRWSLMFYGGAGKAFDKYSDFGSSDWAWSYGSGFRYLIARKLKLRMGLDFAMGPEGFTYYVVFGSSWLRQ